MYLALIQFMGDFMAAPTIGFLVIFLSLPIIVAIYMLIQLFTLMELGIKSLKKYLKT